MDYVSFETAAKQESFEVDGEEVEYTSINGIIAERSGNGNPYQEEAYNTVTAKLTTQKTEANGYFILVLLSIGTILLQQFIMMRSQKEQQKYSSVDGQGASQQKMMMVIMTGMFAIFSFMYSSAFSIYLITSNIFSMISTIVINKFVDHSEAKKAAKIVEVRTDKRASGRLEAAQKAGRSSAQASRDKKNAKSDNTDKN
jgi:membrane protein insertase Oxa1/YidC/SpoIIIJ